MLSVGCWMMKTECCVRSWFKKSANTFARANGDAQKHCQVIEQGQDEMKQDGERRKIEYLTG